MAKDAGEVLAERASFTLAKAMDNLSLCQNFMGLLGRTVYDAHCAGKDVYKVKVGKPYFVQTEHEGAQIRSKVEYRESGVVADSLNFLDRVDGMKDFVGKKSLHMAKVLEKNPSYMEFLCECVRLMENHALHIGREFSRLDVIRVTITDDNTLVMVLS